MAKQRAFAVLRDVSACYRAPDGKLIVMRVLVPLEERHDNETAPARESRRSWIGIVIRAIIG